MMRKIRSVDEVKGVFFNSGQYQVILGTGIVNKVYAEFMQAFNISEVSKDEMSRQGRQLAAGGNPSSLGCVCADRTGAGCNGPVPRAEGRAV